MKSEVAIVIPAFNEGTRIQRVLRQLKELGYSNIIVVDDGSADNTAAISFEEGAKVLRHRINLGSGAATQTGLEYAVTTQPRFIVTMDGDGQHRPDDVDVLFEAIQKEGKDIVIGSRFLQPSGKVPFSRIVANKIANILTYLFTGKYSSDSQSGMKIIRTEFASDIQFQFPGYEFCTELFFILKEKNGSFSEVPIKAIYTYESLGKGQSFKSGIKMVLRLLGDLDEGSIEDHLTGDPVSSIYRD